MVNILQITDTHLFDEPDGELYGIKTRTSLQAVIDDIQSRQLNIDQVLVTGDLVHDAGEQAYRQLGEMLTVLDVPVHYIPGNHDNPDILHQCLPNSPNRNVYSFYASNWLIAMLDSSAVDEVGGFLTETTLEQLEQLLDQNQDAPALVAVHHQAVKTGSEWMDKIGISNSEAFLDRLKHHKQVKLVINGHVHQIISEDVGHFRVLGSPSTCAQFRPQTSHGGIDDTPPGYRYLQLHDDGSFETEVFWLES